MAPLNNCILFDGVDVTDLPPERRNIAKLFQFAVIYDTMSVYHSLAFRLGNLGGDKAVVEGRVSKIAEMLDVTDMLQELVAELSPIKSKNFYGAHISKR